MKRLKVPAVLFWVLMGFLAAGISWGQPSEGVAYRVYTRLMDPREHPDYARHYAKPPTWDTFGNRTQFTSLRGFGVDKNNLLFGYTEEIEKYTTQYQLGNVLWPSYSILFAPNLHELVAEIQQKQLYLFDVMGYVPGSGPGGFWMEYKADPAVFEMLEATLGDHWLGADIGEQDGRYIGGYAPHIYPISKDRFGQYLNFQRHFEHMGDELGNRLATLVSLNFGHYFLKEGTYKLIGAETAQALPNSQVYYAFIRGAGKQYGVPWFGNASVFNRWGYKTYGGESKESGPTKGTSLNLMKRLIYSHLLYNCMLVGFESGWFEGNTLSPIGKMQQTAQQWVQTNGQPGAMLTPVAVMTDFEAGWTFPRHLYSENLYRVWGNLPYSPGDYLTDGVLDMLYPHYQDSSYFHDETGFISPTPYGDCADALLSDAPSWLLARYPLLVIAGELADREETWDKLQQYVESGGNLVITAGNLSKRTTSFLGVSVAASTKHFAAGTVVKANKMRQVEPNAFELYEMTIPKTAQVLARCGSKPAAVKIGIGKGSLVVLASPFGIGCEKASLEKIESKNDNPLPKPFPLLAHVRTILDAVFNDQALFDAGANLSVIACRKAKGEYTIGVCNNTLQAQPLTITSHCGPLTGMTELVMDQSEKTAKGFLPEGFEAAHIGVSDTANIAGGDIRIFRVQVDECCVEEMAPVLPTPRPQGCLLPLRGNRLIKEEILARPTFFEHYDGVSVDWRYVHDRDREALKKEAGWLARQQVRMVVDFSSGLNLYPDLRLINNHEGPYAASMNALQDVMEKMVALGARDLVLLLNRRPENNYTRTQQWAAFEETLRNIAQSAASRRLNVFLRSDSRDGAPLADVIALVKRINAPNLKLALEIAPLLSKKVDPATLAAQVDGMVGLCLLGSPAEDIAGKSWTRQAPICGYDPVQLANVLHCVPGVPVLFDAVYPGVDQEYRDVKTLEQIRHH